jgi:LacI family transcriptional regulator
VSEKPTLAEVAREAGTSQSTASRALSGRGYVSDEVRDRTFAAAEKLGYIPSAPARACARRTTR